MSKGVIRLLVLGLLVARPVCGDEFVQWPQFRGPNGCGVAAEEKRLPVRFGPSENLVWRTALPTGHSSPCLWGSHVFVTGFDEGKRVLETIALERQSGKILWRRTAPAEAIEKVHPVSSPANPTPATDGHQIFVYFGSFGLLSYDFAGNVVWTKPLAFPKSDYGTGTSPAIVGELVIVNDQDQGLPLLAVRRKTGETAWTREMGIGNSLPIVWQHDGVQELIVQSKTRLSSFNLDGSQRWSVDGMPLDAYTTPVIGDGLLFVNFSRPGGDAQDRTLEPFKDAAEKYDQNRDGLLSLDELPKNVVFIERGTGRPGEEGGDITIQRLFGRIAGEDEKINEQEWNQLRQPRAALTSGLWAIRPGTATTLEDSQKAWHTTRSLPEVPSPLYYQGNLYLVRKGGILTCLEARTGKEHYRTRLPVAGSYYSSPVAGDGKIYLASESGVLFVIEAGNRMNLLAQNDLGQRVMATPAIADGTLYVRTESNLFAFRE
jgi:outer membrane protein assembly factor BamB